MHAVLLLQLWPRAMPKAMHKGGGACSSYYDSILLGVYVGASTHAAMHVAAATETAYVMYEGVSSHAMHEHSLSKEMWGM